MTRAARAAWLFVAALLASCKNDRAPAPASPSDASTAIPPSASVSASAAPSASAARDGADAAPSALHIGMLEADDYFPTRGFPAVSDDGRLAVFADRLADGGRGNPNLVVSIRKVADDSEAWSLTVLSPDEWNKKGMEDGGQKVALHRAMKERVDKVNARLAASTWHPLPLGDARPDATSACRDRPAASQRAEIGGVEVALEGTMLRVRPPTPAAPFERDVSAWSAKGVKPECRARNVMRLDRVYADAGRGVVVVRIVYCGDDTCWEPEGAWHVLPLSVTAK